MHAILVVLAAYLSVGGGRKLLQEPKKEDDIPDHNSKGKNYKRYSASTKVGIAAAGTFLICCVFMCPCFYRKKRTTAHNVLANDPNSSESLTCLAVSGQF